MLSRAINAKLLGETTNAKYMKFNVVLAPFIRTGKRLPTKVTEIVVNFKKNNNIFSSKNESNTLIFRLQPDEGMLVKFNLKKPGHKSEIINKNLSVRQTEKNTSNYIYSIYC